MGKVNVYEMVTDQIIQRLEKGVVPWRKPWQTSAHQNIANKREYRGINQLLCEMYMMDNPEYELPWWTTYKGAKEKLGGNVKKGEKGQIVVLWKPFFDKDDEGNESEKPTGFMLRYYNVFNVAQLEGDDLKLPEVVENEVVPKDEAEKAIKNMPDPPSIKYGGSSAYYQPSTDHVQVPKPEKFDDMDAYYSTNFHELMHSTGHESRLNRKEITELKRWGNADYSKEELTAEIGAAMICAKTGIDPSTQDRAASYIGSWLKKLNDDHKFVLQAAQRASKGAKYILNEEDEKVEKD